MPASAFTQLGQELIGRNKEWVLLQNTANDDHGMGTHDVNDYVPAKLGEIICSYQRVLITRQNIVQPGLVLHQVIDPRPVFEGPFHMRY